MMSSWKSVAIALLVVLLARPNLAHAQGAIVNGAAGVVVADGASDLEISAGIGYRFNRVLGFGIELTQVPSLETNSAFDPAVLRLCCSRGDLHADGHATVFTTNVRVEVPTTMKHVLPFVVGGGGLASVTEKFPLIYYAVPLANQLTAGLTVPTPILPGPQQFVSNTTLAMALTLGGGASFLLTDRLAIDGDLRVLKLIGEPGRTLGRFQVGASYRF